MELAVAASSEGLSGRRSHNDERGGHGFLHRIAEDPSGGFWKRIDSVQGALPAKDAGCAARAGGVITEEEYFGKLSAGES